VQESKVVLKTRLDYYDKIREIIKDNCNYEVPEILYFKIDGGNKEYFDWVDESTPIEFVRET
jgi:periplasmic divalent cation tolerance protein